MASTTRKKHEDSWQNYEATPWLVRRAKHQQLHPTPIPIDTDLAVTGPELAHTRIEIRLFRPRLRPFLADPPAPVRVSTRSSAGAVTPRAPSVSHAPVLPADPYPTPASPPFLFFFFSSCVHISILQTHN